MNSEFVAAELSGTTERPRRQFRFFPGWIMLGIASAALFMSAPGQSYSVAAFKDPMRIALSISETDYSFAYAIATLFSGLSLPWVGRMVDAVGARRMLPVIAVLLGLACSFMSRIDSLIGLFVGFTLIRCLGQGALTLVGNWLVGEWFEQRRGLATAICGLGGSVSVICFPLLNGYVITEHGWNWAWQFLALLVWIILVIPAALFIRDRPEDLGLQPDGLEPLVPGSDGEDPAPRPASDPRSGSYRTDESWTVREVLRDRTFWKLLAVPVTGGMVGTGLVFHQVTLMDTHGVSPQWALSLISLQAIVATVTALLAGWLTDRIQNRYLMSAAMVFLALAIGLFLIMPHPWLLVVYAALLGLHGSVQRSTGSVIWINYYGRAHQGAVRGAAYSAMVLASALGPLPLALSWDRFGTWEPALFLFMLIPLVSAVLVWSAHPPIRSAQQRT